ncbi:MAG TPA: serine/threonine-protein kinase [Myxococcaceae bacterium]|nr:serine/threonine-protein kinase [Myxococcaceae bacterium]
MPPKVIGPYRVLDTLGSGGAGTVYRALDRRTGEPVALKLLSTGPALDPRAARRLAREFETLSELSHPNVVKVFDTGVHHGYPYLAMELVDGLTLRNYLDLDAPEKPRPKPPPPKAAPAVPWEDSDTGEWSGPRTFTLSQLGEEPPSDEAGFGTGPASVRALADAADEPDTHESRDVSLPYELEPPGELPTLPVAAPVDTAFLNRPDRTARLRDALLQLCDALSYVHGHGLVHRDLKPSNVMVDEDQVVRLMDFGLAKFLAEDGAVTAGGRLVGTFRYMSPEQILGEQVDPRADLYSLGVILYELLTGRPPFDARTPPDLWQKVLETEAPAVQTLNPGADPALARIAQRLIRKEPSERFQTAEEVREALAE